MNKEDYLYDRAFDASCVKRAGEDEWARQIITRLKATYPKDADIIDMLYNGYLDLPMAEYIESRQNYMLENRHTLKLRYE